jgi:hypothetical protein
MKRYIPRDLIMIVGAREDRVRAHSAVGANERIDSVAQRRVRRAAGQPGAVLTQHIQELDREWDMERWLETNASALALGGTVLGLFVNKKFFAVPCVVLSFLLLHALEGWCPPVPILRRKGVRTRREIDAEKYALKALRGDFAATTSDREPFSAAQVAWSAVNS